KASAAEQKKTVQSYKDQLEKGFKQLQEQDQLNAKGVSSVDAGGSSGASAGEYSSGHGAAAGKGREAAKAWIEKGLAAKGIPKKDWPAWENGLLTMMERESSFNPGAVNNWDSNAQAGHASVGVLQMIPSTFNSYKVAGLDDIMDPSAQVASCIGYVMSRYGVSADGSNLTSLVQQADRSRPPKGY
ncbi:MAG: transglycosylase SLT domain-containing protein, partial [Segniliparus sp.]|uniref:transglycosylase SLT domain-containing protein n=1 Tax=Segniliparus sp. TaxID=2804064 RepID=UPI003F3A0450